LVAEHSRTIVRWNYLTCDIAGNIIRGVALSYVLDTDVIIAAFRSDRGASRQLLLAALHREFELLLSVPLILEYEAVLTRPEHLAACGLSGDEASRVLDDLAAIARPVRLAFRWRPRLSDPDDDMVLETAINGNAGAIVTFNQRDFATGIKDFRCGLLLPAMALREIRS
jgi:putative PIN family toxin of toxin-antitoxin system